MKQALEQLRSQAGPGGGLGSLSGVGGLADQMPSWMPPAAAIVALTAVIVGAVVWLFGAKLIKPAFVLIGGVIGSAAGAVFMPSVTSTIMGIPAAYPGMGIGLMVGMILAVLVYRFAIASLAAGVLGAAAILSAIVGLGYVPGAIPVDEGLVEQDGRIVIRADGTEGTLRDQVETQVRDWSGRLKDAAQKYKDAKLLTSAGAPDAPQVIAADGSTPEDPDKERIEAAKRTARAISDHIAERWQALPTGSRFTLAGAWMAGAMMGFLLGLVMPKKAAAAISSLSGAAMLLAGGVSLAERYAGAGPQLAGVSALGWLGVWLVVSAIGLFVQSRNTRPKQAAAPQAAPVAA